MIGIILGVVLVASVAGAYCYHQHQGLLAAVTTHHRPITTHGYTTTALITTNSTLMTTALEEELIGQLQSHRSMLNTLDCRIHKTFETSTKTL